MRRRAGIAPAMVTVILVAFSAMALSPAEAEGTGEVRAAASGLSVQFIDDGLPSDSSRLAPGRSVASRLRVTNASPWDADLRIHLENWSDEEAGCLRPEMAIPEEGCEDDQGELGEWLLAVVKVPSGESRLSDTVLYDGSLRDLVDGASLIDGLRAGETVPLTVSIELPWEAGNETQSDQATFDLILTASSDLPDGGVPAIEESSPGDEPPSDDTTRPEETEQAEDVDPPEDIDQVEGVDPPEDIDQVEDIDPREDVTPPIEGDRGVPITREESPGESARGGAGALIELPATGGALPLWLLLTDVAVLMAGGLLVRRAMRERNPAQG